MNVWDREYIKNKVEDSKYDRKSIRIKPKDLARTIIAFANSEGGKILVGVEDDMSITGVDGYESEINGIKSSAKLYCVPSIECEFNLIRITDDSNKPNHILLIDIPKGTRVYEDATGDAYHRIGDKSMKMSFNERLSLSNARGEINFELMPVAGTSVSDLSFQTINKHISKIGCSLSLDEYIHSNRIIVNEKNEISVKGILLFGNDPQKYFERANIRFIRFEGTEELTGTKLNVIKEVTFNGRLLDQIEESIKFVSTQIKEKSFLGEDGKFVTQYEYPEFCWRELIINAVTHRDYSIIGTDIQLKMFDDKFVVESPGTFPGFINEYNIKANHYSRNRDIANYMRENNLVKEFGEGVKRVYQEMSLARLPEPTFKKRDFMVISTLKNSNAYFEIEERKTMEQIAELVDKNPNITLEELSSKINKPKRTILRLIKSKTDIKNY